jgi:hypothetical protein
VRRLTFDYSGPANAVGQVLSIFRDLGYGMGEAEALNEAGTLHHARGDISQAMDCHRQTRDIAVGEISSDWHEAQALVGLGRCAVVSGRPADGGADLQQA